jgi:hypothetical protein
LELTVTVESLPWVILVAMSLEVGGYICEELIGRFAVTPKEILGNVQIIPASGMRTGRTNEKPFCQRSRVRGCSMRKWRIPASANNKKGASFRRRPEKLHFRVEATSIQDWS